MREKEQILQIVAIIILIDSVFQQLGDQPKCFGGKYKKKLVEKLLCRFYGPISYYNFSVKHNLKRT